MKVYLPRPAGKFGLVLRIELREGKSLLAYAAFGVRHHPGDSHALTVYEIAPAVHKSVPIRKFCLSIRLRSTLASSYPDGTR